MVGGLEAAEPADARPTGTGTTVVGAVVGIDGCGKSSAFHGALGQVARQVDIVGIGDEVLAGAPGLPVHERADLPLCRLTSGVGRVAKRTRRAWAYRQLKSLDLIGRSRMRDWVIREEAPAALLTDGDPLVNTMSWSVGRLYRDELMDDDAVVEALRYLAGDRRIPLSRLPYYLRHSWQLAVVNRLHIARFAFPDLVVLLQLDAGEAMERIRRRGRPLQTHETEAGLAALGSGYDRVCALMEASCGVRVVRIPVGRTAKTETAQLVAEALLELVPEPPQPSLGDVDAAPVEVIATTISGSLRDQRKIGRIGPHFAALTRRRTRVHAVDSHEEARRVTEDIVARGGRIIVSAGGAGTFNAVLEGCHQNGQIPADLRLAFLRKGSADLIGKALRIPDELEDGVAAIVDGIELDRRVSADVLAVKTNEAGAGASIRHLVGFGGLGIFGVVPRFTEARWVRLYKGILGTLFGDYGPFYVGLALATMWWYVERSRGRVPPLSFELDGEQVGTASWTAVIVVNGDLGSAFPLGRGLSFGSGTFRVVAMRDLGLAQGLRQLSAARTGAILEEPERFGCLVREVRTFDVRPQASMSAHSADALMLNVDGLAMLARGAVHFSTSERVELIAGPE